MKKHYTRSFKKAIIFLCAVLFAQNVFAQAFTFNPIPAQTYGGANLAPGATASSGSITYTSSNAAVATIVSGNIHITGAGTSTITATNGTNMLTQTLTVNKAPLTITANNHFVIQGKGLPALTVSYSGFVNGDSQSEFTTQPSVTTTGTTSSAMGNYPITVSGGSSTDYTFTYVAGTLTVVTEAYLTAAVSKTYGAAPFYALGEATGGLTYTSNNTSVATVAPATGLVTITGAGTATIAFGSGSGQLGKVLTVARAPLTITAGSHTVIQGKGVPALTVTYSGFVNGDTQAEFTTQPTVSTTGTSSSPMGSYPITVSGGSSTDYSFTYVPGTLTIVTEAYLTSPISSTYGAAPFYTFLEATTGLTYSSSNTSVATVSPSNGLITITGAGTATIAFNSGNGQLGKTLTVNKASLTITANNQSKVAGSANPTLTVSYSGFVNGDTQTEFTTQPTVSTTATTSSGAGSYPITVSGGTSADYTFTYVAGQLTVTAPATGVPVISYTTPQTYTEGTAITPLAPANKGGAVPLYIYGKTTVFAGTNGVIGSANGTGTAATFGYLNGAATDPQGNVYVASGGDDLIRKITPAGVVTTFAGSGTAGSANGTGTAASFNQPSGVACDASGNVYVADAGNGLVRKITPAGVVTTLENLGSSAFPAAVALDKAGNVYVADGNQAIDKITPAGVLTTISSAFNSPFGVAVNSSGSIIYVTDFNNRVYTLTQAGVVKVLAGSGAAGAGNGTGAGATFNNPNNLSVDALGNVYVNDSSNNLIRVVSPSGVVTTLAGSGAAGAANGTGTAASLNFPYGSAIDPTGNYLYVANTGSYVIQKIDITGYSISPVLPQGLAIDSTGTIKGTSVYANNTTNYTVSAHNAYGAGSTPLTITVTGNNYKLLPPQISYPGAEAYTAGTAIKPVSPSNAGGAVPAAYYGKTAVFAGSNGVKGSSNGTGTAATFKALQGVTTDAQGNIYVADAGNYLIRKITPAGVVTTFAGSGVKGSANGTGTAATFTNPGGLAIDVAGNIYVADGGDGLVRKITPAGVVSTVAPTYGSFNFPAAVAVDNAGNVYVADGNSAIDKITPGGVVTTISSAFNSPFGVAVNPSGSIIYVSDGSNRVFTLTPGGVVTVLAGSGAAGSANGTDTTATFNNPNNITVDVFGNLYVNDSSNNLVRIVSPGGVVTTLAGSGAAGAANGIGTAASFNFPFATAIDPTGNYLYVSNSSSYVVQKVDITGYSIAPALPLNLAMDSTGTIKGTPAADSEAASYTITAYNTAGSSSATISIAIAAATTNAVLAFVQPEVIPVVHTAVSPNGDGINDVLTIDNIGKYPQNTLMLMNERGAKVYQASGYDNVNKAFDGHSNINGKLQQPGTYFYMLQYSDNGVMKSTTGYIVLRY
jgi:DNA-binding beta-propeller fold protein YncE